MDDFQIVKQLGSGSFGKVLKVLKKDQNNLKQYAIKLIKINQLSFKQKDNALNEIRLLASIDSPFIIKYKSAFFEEKNNLLCIVMEYADGGDLQGLIKKKLMQNNKFPQNFIWQVAYDILRGLKVLHSHKIIHRDIKPANIFFVNGVAKLGDLNVSKVMEGRFAMTQTGTPYYTSPQIWVNRSYDYRCDIWSVGCVLYELCTLHPPFLAKDFPSLKKKVCQGTYESLPPFYSRTLSRMIKRCLALDILKRPIAEQLVKENLFEMLEQNQQGEVQLLDTIRCPQFLNLLNSKLPEDQYDTSKKVKTLKLIHVNSQNQHTFEPKSMKKFHLKSAENQFSSIFKSQKKIEKQNQNECKHRLQMPLQSPKGYLKLPKIQSRKNILEWMN